MLYCTYLFVSFVSCYGIDYFMSEFVSFYYIVGYSYTYKRTSTNVHVIKRYTVLRLGLLEPPPTYTTYAINWNRLNNLDREPPRNHSCEV